MVLLSQFPIDAAASRTFQLFLAKDMPGALLPKDPQTGLPWYSQEDLKVCCIHSVCCNSKPGLKLGRVC
jgi:hypothetical protein